MATIIMDTIEKTVNISDGGDEIQNCVGISNKSEIDVFYSFLPFSQDVLGSTLSPRQTMFLPDGRTTVFVRSAVKGAYISAYGVGL